MVAIVEDKAYIDDTEKPAAYRGTGTIKNGIAHPFHILIMVFHRILMLVVRFCSARKQWIVSKEGIGRQIPWELQLLASLNALEFLASYVMIFMDIHVGNTPADSCFLSQGNSTLAMGWLQKSNFNDAQPLHLSLAHAMANLLMDHDSCLYSQWFPGKDNIVTNLLSQDTHLNDASLLTHLLSHVPKEIPEGFCICPLLPKLVSQIMTWLHKLPALMESLGAPL